MGQKSWPEERKEIALWLSGYLSMFYNWVEKEGYDLYIGANGKPESHVSWRIKNVDLKSQINISIHPYLFNLKSTIVCYFLSLSCS